MKISLIKSSDIVAMVDVEKSVTYRQILRAAGAAAEFFSENMGPIPASGNAADVPKIAIFAENRMEWAYALYGIWAAGAAAVPIDASSSDDELEFILRDADCRIICCTRENLRKTECAAAKLEHAPKAVALEDLFPLGRLGESAGKNAANPPEEISRESEELGLLVYTSGTTGNPKGVMLTFANMYANMCAVAEAKYYEEGVRVLTMLPFHHILPIMGTLVMPLSINGKMVFPKSISPADIAAVLEKYSVDMIISVPRFYELLHANIMAKIGASKIASLLFWIAKMADSPALSRRLFGAVHKKFGGEVKFWISGGAALDKKVWRDLDILGFGIREGYGMTECAPIIAFPRIGRVRIGSPGEALPGIEIRIVDGEISVRGGNVTAGYYKRPKETAEAIRDGWLFTGDMGYVDEDGFLFITGRRKEIIVLANGKNLNPADMEAQIKAQSPEVVECGVLMHENMLKAIVRVPAELLSRGAEAAEEHIRNTVILPYNRGTAMYKRIIKFALTDGELPRTRVGKLKRFHLASYFENISSAKPKRESLPEPDSETYRRLKGVLKAQIAMPPSADAHMEMDLGLDSLGKISMQCFIRENYGVEISERDFEKYPSLRKMSALVEESRSKNFEPTNRSFSWPDIINGLPRPVLPRPHMLHFASIFALRALSKLLYRVHASGTQNLAGAVPLIIAPNHQCYLDGLFVSQSLTNAQAFKTRFFAKTRRIIRRGFLKAFARRSNVLIMDINDNVSGSIRELAQALRQGESVMIFPEGTRTKDGCVGEFKQTFAIMAKEMGVPVVPVAIRGAYNALKAGATFPKLLSDIYVDYLPQMKARADESYENFAKRVQEAVEKKCSEPLPARQ